jgi:carboxyl-terminal processing protease
MAAGALKQPESPVYKGPIFILQDRFCASACEDFTMPLKTSRRATIFGERTFGSSGQPYLLDFQNGMGVRVRSKRMYLPVSGSSRMWRRCLRRMPLGK